MADEPANPAPTPEPPPAPTPAPSLPPTRAPRQADVRWRGHVAPTPVAAKNKSTALVLLGIVLALGAAAAASFFYLSPKPAPFLLTFPIREYKFKPYPVNFFADQDSSLLVRHFPIYHHKAFESQDRSRLLLELANLKNKADRPLVVHITALAREKDGDVFLLPGDADPDDDATWLPLYEVLNGIARAPTKQRLLILDLAKPVAGDPRLGFLIDRVSEALDAKLSKNLPPDLWVLTSTSAGQESFAAEAAGASAFGYYLDQGLSGHADGYGEEGRKDRRITVRELAEFTTRRVDRWAMQNFGAGQAPRLVGLADDFVLVNLDEVEPAAPAKTAANVYPDWLKKGFEKRDTWWTIGMYRRAPLVFQQLEAHLVRFESRWRGGFDGEKLKADLNDVLVQLEDLAAQANAPLDVPARSLQRSFGGKDHGLTALVLAFRQQLPRVGTFEKAEDELKAREAVMKAIADPKEISPLHAYAIFDVLADLPEPTPKQLAFGLQLIQQLQPTGKFLEVVYLQRLVDFENRIKDNDRTVWKWDGAQVSQLLRTMRARESLIVALQQEPSLLPWIAHDFPEAESKRRAGEQGLLSEHHSKWKQAQVANQLAGEMYRQLLERVQSLNRARRVMDESFAVLPGHAAWLREGSGNLLLKNWREAIAETRKLADYFADPPTKGQPASTVLLSVGLTSSLKGLENEIAHRRERAEKSSDVNAIQDYRAAANLLKSPRLASRERESLWKAGVRLQSESHQRTTELDERDNRGSQTPPAGPPVRIEERYPGWNDLANARAGVSFDLLKLAGLSNSGEVKDLKDFDGIALSLRNAWSRQIVERYRAVANEPAQADRVSRLLPPLEHDVDGILAQNPARVLAQQNSRQFRLWLGDAYRAESQFLKSAASKESPAAAQFFLEAAQELAR